MAYVVAIVGTLVWLGLFAVSAFMNFQFGMTLSDNPVYQVVYGIISVAGDGFKAIIPFAIGWALASRPRNFPVAGIGAALFLLASAYSLMSAVGFASVSRAETSAEIQADINALRSLQDELSERRDSRSNLPTHRPVATVEALIQAAEQDRSWASTDECEDVTVERSRRFCDRYFTLRGELATATNASDLDREITSLRAAIKAKEAAGISADGEADPQIAALQRIFGTENPGAVVAAITLIIALFVELGSGSGLYVTHAHLAKRPDKRKGQGAPAPVSSVRGTVTDDDWAEERLIADAGARVAATELYRDYIQFCTVHGRADTMTQTAFGSWLAAEGFSEKKKSAGIWYYLGLRLRDARDVVINLDDRRTA